MLLGKSLATPTIRPAMHTIFFHTPYQSGSSSSSSLMLPRVLSPIMFLAAIILLLTSSVVDAINTTTYVLPPVTSLTMAVTETIVIDCRIDVDELSLYDVTITWNAPLLRTPNGRMQIETKNINQTAMTSLSSTLRLVNISANDTGSYRCVASYNGTEMSQSEINVTVSSELGRCEFEANSGLCGWTIDAGTTSSWQRYNCCDETTQQADHTYGPVGNRVGHMMKTSLLSVNTTSFASDKPAKLMSPSVFRPVNASALCFGFWYILQDGAVLNVTMTTNNKTSFLKEIRSITSSSDSTDNVTWKQAIVVIKAPFPVTSFQVILSLSVDDTCTTCYNATVLVDDVTFTSADCQGDTTVDQSMTSPIIAPTSSNNHSPASNDVTLSINFLTTSALSMSSSTRPTTVTVATSTRPSTASAPTVTSTSTTPVTSTPVATTASLKVEEPDKHFTSQDIETTAFETPGVSSPVSRSGTVDDIANDTTEDDSPLDDGLVDADHNPSTGLVIGLVAAVLATVMFAVILVYRRQHRGRKSTYITFGNPSYSREHLPANDFSLDSPLTLSSNGYTVLA